MTTKKPRTKKPATATSAAVDVTAQILPRGSVAAKLPAPFTAPAPYVKKKPSWS